MGIWRPAYGYVLHFPAVYHAVPTPLPRNGRRLGHDYQQSMSTNDATPEEPLISMTTADLMADLDEESVGNYVHDTEPEDLLMVYQVRYEDENRPSILDKLELFVNKICQRSRNPKTFKNTMAKHPRPDNLVMQKDLDCICLVTTHILQDILAVLHL